MTYLTLNHIFSKPKDPVSKEQKSDAIYSIPCNDCNQEYIGQIKRQFGTRLKEHQKAVALSRKDNSALSEHTCQTNHTITWTILKLLLPISDTIKDVVWKLGTSIAPTLHWIVTTEDYYWMHTCILLILINRWCHYPKSSIKGNSLRRSDHPWWRH